MREEDVRLLCQVERGHGRTGASDHAVAIGRNAICENGIAELLEALENITSRGALLEEMTEGGHGYRSKKCLTNTSRLCICEEVRKQ